MTQFLCCGCDTERATIRAYCHSCASVMDSYKYEPTEREVFAAERASSFDAERVTETAARELRVLSRLAA